MSLFDGKYLYPFEIGLNKILSKAILKANVALFIFSKQSFNSSALAEEIDTTNLHCIKIITTNRY